ncbi:hypothetical protein KZZ07_13055 [Mameliella sp. CS4]|uniref:hypothetical protein n=1 Tax=Mameliella sp. CS4 TaxID=2862329 RepID=UPI001C5CEF6B|nr:hypothetical protein [Mameliella sp. CS4]MBW4983470.1 hypothetical protein [Mameliella sp. CS4]
MQKALIKEIAYPLARRLGTAIGAFLIGYGADAELVNQFVIASTALGLIMGDLAVSWAARR